jgi:membrane glycosyltransferase
VVDIIAGGHHSLDPEQNGAGKIFLGKCDAVRYLAGVRSHRGLHLFMGVVPVVLFPKILGLGRTIAGSFDARSRIRLVAGSLIEIVTSTLIAPILHDFADDVLAILRGRDSGWNAQRPNQAPP